MTHLKGAVLNGLLSHFQGGSQYVTVTGQARTCPREQQGQFTHSHTLIKLQLLLINYRWPEVCGVSVVCFSKVSE